MLPDGGEVDFLVAEFNNQYEQFRHQDRLRTNYLQIYFSLATVLLAGTGLALSTTLDESLPLLALVAFGYLFLFVVGQLSVRMMISLRVVQLETAVLLDLIRTYLADRYEIRSVLLYAGRLQAHPFYEPDASSTWVYRFIGMLNGVFLTGAVGFLVAAVMGSPLYDPDRVAIAWAVVVTFVLLVAAIFGVRLHNEKRLKRSLLGLRRRLDLDAVYGALPTSGPGGE